MSAHNHNAQALKVKSGVKAGGLFSQNHNARLTVRSGLKAGGMKVHNHNSRLVRIVKFTGR
jgi:hypothetical protein